MSYLATSISKPIDQGKQTTLDVVWCSWICNGISQFTDIKLNLKDCIWANADFLLWYHHPQQLELGTYLGSKA